MGALVDQYGQKIEDAALAVPQTASLVNIQREVGAHPSLGLTPQRLNSILQDAERGNLIAQSELFTDMLERDAHVFAELSKRKRAVIRLDWDVRPPRNASAAEVAQAAYAKEVLEDMPDFEDLLFDMLSGIEHGFSCTEMEWYRVGSEWLVKTFQLRPHRWFQLDTVSHQELRLRDNTFEGQAFRPFGWLVHMHKAVSGYVSRSGLGRVLVWPYLFKHYSVGDLAEFLDICGLPIIIGKYPANTLDPEKKTLWRAVAALGHDTRGVIPASMTIELMQAAHGTADPFEAMIAWCERAQSKAISGSTTMDSSGSTGLGAWKAKVDKEISADIRDSDCKQLEGTITNQLIYPLLALNKGFSDARRCPRFVFDTGEADELKAFADAIPKLVQVGVQVPESWVRDRLRIPAGQAGEAMLKVPAAAASMAAADAAADGVAEAAADQRSAAASSMLVTASETQGVAPPLAIFEPQNAVDGALAEHGNVLQEQAQEWLRPALEALTACSSAEEALALLTSKNPLVDDAVLEAALAHMMFIVELVGADAALSDLSD